MHTCKRRLTSYVFAPVVLMFALSARAHTQSTRSAATGTTASPITLPPGSPKHQRDAEAAFLSGAKHLEQSRYAEAERDFARATALNPSKTDYLSALVLAREHHVTSLLQQAASVRPANPAAADSLVGQARALDSTNPRVQQHGEAAGAVQVTRATRLAGPLAVTPNSSTHSYHQRGDLQTILRRVAADYGLRVAFDPDLRQITVRLDLDDATYADAIRAVSLTANVFAVPLDEQTLIFTSNTPANRQRYERMVQESFFMPGVSANDLKDYVSIAQNVLDIRQVSVEPLNGNIVLRGPADRVAAVEAIYDDLQKGTSDVVLDIKLYSVDKQRVSNIGVVLPASLSGFSLASQAQSIVNQNSSLVTQLLASGVLPSTASTVEIAAYLVFAAGLGSTNALFSNSFAIFGGGLTTGVLSAGTIPAINLALSQSDARALDDVQLRVGDRTPATFKAGTRYPIQTSLYSDIANPAASSLASTTVNGVSLSSLLASYLGTSTVGNSAVIPQVQYEDLGFTLTATPRILRTSDVGMKLEIKVASLAGTALNGIPVLNNQQFSSDLTVHDGDTVMMVGNASKSETAAVTGLPGLSELPGFQSTTNRNSSTMTNDLVLLVTPHIVRRAHMAAAGPYIPLAARPGDE